MDNEREPWSPTAQAALDKYKPKDEGAVANTDPRVCTCHPDDNPPVPCPRKFATTDCRIAALLAAAAPFAEHDWYDAGQEDDSCQLVKHSGLITVGHWRALRTAVAALERFK